MSCRTSVPCSEYRKLSTLKAIRWLRLITLHLLWKRKRPTLQGFFVVELDQQKHSDNRSKRFELGFEKFNGIYKRRLKPKTKETSK